MLVVVVTHTKAKERGKCSLLIEISSYFSNPKL